MRRKNYFHFAVPRVLTGLVIGALIFGVLTTYFQRLYRYAIWAGFENRRDSYERILKSYDEHRYNKTFIDIFTSLYTADYLRLAKVNEDGTFENITETDYEVIPIEDEVRNWYFITNNQALLDKEKITDHVNDDNWTIQYKKCDEAQGLINICDQKMVNSWDIVEMSDDVYYSNWPFQLVTYVSGNYYFSQPCVKTYYVDGDTLHLGKVVKVRANYDMDIVYPVKWDFTDPDKADLYKPGKKYTIDGEEYESDLYIFNRAVRPDAYLNKMGDVFLAKNIDDLKSACDEHIESENSDFEYSPAGPQYEKEFGYIFRSDAGMPYTQGMVKVLEINGQQYLMEYIMSTASFEEFAKPFLILMAVTLLFFCLAVSLLLAVSPYHKYKKAYENNNFKNNLIDSLAHNMKTPLQILGGYAENLKDVKSDAEKDHYADQILAKTNEMNKDIEAILKTAEKSDLKLKKVSVRACVEEAAKRVGAELILSGDREIKMDKDYFSQAIYCLIDNAYKYKAEGATIDVKIDKNDIVITNKTDAEKFTPGTGIAIAGRILEQHKLHLNTAVKAGIFEAKITKKPVKK